MARLASDRGLLLELFVLSNLAFLVVDILVAHAVNDFAHWAEWVPFYYGAGGTIALLVSLVATVRRNDEVRMMNDGGVERGAGDAERRTGDVERVSGQASRPGGGRSRLHRVVGDVVGWAGVAVGVSGFIWHLEGHFFQEVTLRHLVYSAPFAAPLAFAGLGLLLLMNRRVPADAPAWATWVLVFALGGFIGNFALSLADHAQNGFFHAAEWIPVVASAIAVGYLFTAVLAAPTPRFRWVGYGVLAVQVVVGVAGFALHVVPKLGNPEISFFDRVVYGAPVFAPLLFADLAILALIGLAAYPGRWASPATPNPGGSVPVTIAD